MNGKQRHLHSYEEMRTMYDTRRTDFANETDAGPKKHNTKRGSKARGQPSNTESGSDDLLHDQAQQRETHHSRCRRRCAREHEAEGTWHSLRPKMGDERQTRSSSEQNKGPAASPTEQQKWQNDVLTLLHLLAAHLNLLLKIFYSLPSYN